MHAKTVDYKAKILDIKKYYSSAYTVNVYRLQPDRTFDFLPGQYVELSCDDFKNRANPNKLKWSAFSIASSPLQDYLELCIRVMSTQGLTYHIAETKKVNDTLNIRGPFGTATFDDTFDEIIFVGLGTGIAWVLSMLRTLALKKDKRPIHMFCGFRNSHVYLYRNELEDYAKKIRNFKLNTTLAEVDPIWDGHVGFAQDLIKDYKFEQKRGKIQVYLCGPIKAILSVKTAMLNQGFNLDNLHYELW